MRNMLLYMGALSSNNVFAVITVTATDNGTITVTNGEKTLTAELVDKTAVIAIPKAGTWTITGNNGTDRVSETVEITYRGQVASVLLVFPLVLFTTGSPASITGGFSPSDAMNSNGYVGSYVQAYQYNGVKTSSKSVYTKSRIDLSDYSTLHFQVVGASSANGNAVRTVGITSSVNGSFAYSKSVSSTGEHKVNLSSASGSYGIKIYNEITSWTNQSANSNLWVSKIWVD